jgi:hypothetical protein
MPRSYCEDDRRYSKSVGRNKTLTLTKVSQLSRVHRGKLRRDGGIIKLWSVNQRTTHANIRYQKRLLKTRQRNNRRGELLLSKD